MSTLSPTTILSVILIYFLILIAVARITSRGADNATFFIANRKSPWLLVAIGMIGASLSGVTFISIPGVIGRPGLNENFSYMQTVFGYLLGYLVIGTILMPLYYRLQLTTIYKYLDLRLGPVSYRSGAAFFLLSRIIGASFRLFLVAIVLQTFVMDALGVPFVITVAVTILLIWIYTFQGGIKTIVWTDTLQTICMLSAVALTIIAICGQLEIGYGEMWSRMSDIGYNKIFYFEGGWSDPNNFFKQFFGGALIAVTMTGMDQDMMQKNLTCKSLGDAQKNIFTFSIILIFANLLFLALGALLYIYAGEISLTMPERTDLLFPTIALEYLHPAIGIVFILGLVAAAYSSADSALTSLTTSFCIDFLNFERDQRSEAEKRRTRLMVHLGFSILLLVVIVIFQMINNSAIINALFKVSQYTYGPILGLFVFGMMTDKKVKDRYVYLVCLIAPLLSYIIDHNSARWFSGFEFGFLTMALNGLLTMFGLWLIRDGTRLVADQG